jgi:hypothetical protein
MEIVNKQTNKKKLNKDRKCQQKEARRLIDERFEFVSTTTK